MGVAAEPAAARGAHVIRRQSSPALVADVADVVTLGDVTGEGLHLGSRERSTYLDGTVAWVWSCIRTDLKLPKSSI